MICITNKLHYINTENMIELTDMINTNIISGNIPNYFLYMIGANNKNMDEFIKLLSLKLYETLNILLSSEFVAALNLVCNSRAKSDPV